MLNRCTSKMFPKTVEASISLTTVLRSLNDLVLNLFAEFDEIGAVAGDTNHQAAKLLGILLRAAQRVR